jgi:hypothetical protein
MFTNIIMETRLHTGDWWGQGEPIHISAVRLLKDVVPGGIRNVIFRDVICRSESGIVVYGTNESMIEDVSFENLTLRISESPLNAVAGGNFDLRPVLDPSLQLFAHDIPGIYAQWVKNFRIRGCNLTWDASSMSFFTHGIEISDFRKATLFDFTGSAAPGNARAYPVVVTNGKGFTTDVDRRSVRTVNVEDYPHGK